MRSLTRPRVLATAAVALGAAGGASQLFGSAHADPVAKPRPGQASNLILGSKDGTQPENMEQFLTAVTTDVDAYWTQVFKDSGLPEPRVGYSWIPAGQTAASACGDESGTLGDSAAAYCPGDDTIYISQKFATDIYTGALDQALPGSSQGYGRTVGDFSVAYIVAHEYGHQVQEELGLFDKHGQQLPTMAFELQADCYAGTWANSAYRGAGGDLAARRPGPGRRAGDVGRRQPRVDPAAASSRRRGTAATATRSSSRRIRTSDTSSARPRCTSRPTTSCRRPRASL